MTGSPRPYRAARMEQDLGMQVVARMYVNPNATIRSMLVGPRRCGVPTMFGSIGTDSGGDDIFALAFEWTS